MDGLLKKIFFAATACLLAGIFFAVSSGAEVLPLKTDFEGKAYYIVSGSNPGQNTGEEVCSLVGKSCVGYTLSNSANADCDTELDPSSKKMYVECRGDVSEIPATSPSWNELLNDWFSARLNDLANLISALFQKIL